MVVLLLGTPEAFLLFVAGVLAVYCEFIWPGRIWTGLTGGALVLGGSYFLWRSGPSWTGLILLGLAAIFFVMEIFWRVPWIASGAGAVALVTGFCLLFPATRRIPPVLSIPVSMLLGAITVLLARAAKQARHNKRSDVDRPN